MEKMLLSRYLTISFFLTSTIGFAQHWEEEKSIFFKQDPSAMTADIQGNVFIGFADGQLRRYNSEGKLLETFSFNNNSAITLIDTQNNLRPFIFYFDIQQIVILDRFSSLPKIYSLSEFGVSLGMMACPAPDGDFWVEENNPQRLLKINPLRKSLVAEVQVQLGDTIRQMRTYQNLLLILDENGLNVFDQFGGRVHKINIEGSTNFHITNQRVLVFTLNQEIAIDPFKGSVINTSELPSSLEKALRINGKMVGLKGRRLTFYKSE